jgi:outer membrane protein insertion porin family
MKEWRAKGRRTGCLLLLFYFLFFSYSFLSEAEGAALGKIEIHGLYSIGKDELLDLLCFKDCKQIDSERIRRGIKRAFLKGIFEDICIDVTEGERPNVIINVKERDFIKKIYIEGEYSLSKRFIRDNFLLKEDQVMRYDLIDSAIEKLKQEIAMRGFPDAVITPKIEKTRKPYRVNIHLQVNTGEPEKIKKIIISGGSEEIQNMMSLSEGDIYDQKELNNDLEKIKRYYKNKGYFKPVIGPYTFDDGILHISVNPGKRLIISIEDNHAISTKTLRKEMPFFEVENFNDDLVQEAVTSMFSLYHAKGYPFAQIAPVITSKDDLITTNFFIFEGMQVKIKTISFSGISLPGKNIRDVMSLKEGGHYNPDIIETDKNTIIEVYNALGYLSASVEEFKTRYEKSSHEMDIAIKIHEGPKTEIEKVDVVGTKLISDEEVRKAIRLKPGDPYNEVDILNARYRITDLYDSRGFLDATVTIQRNFEDNKVSLIFKINEDGITFFGKTIITGNYRTKYEVVKRELKQHEGMPFDNSLLTKERQAIFRLGLFTNIEMEELNTYDHKKDVLISLNEADAGAIEFGLGYGDYEKYRGFVDLSYRNLWGMNRQGSIRLEMSSIEKRSILQYVEPWFLDIQMPLKVFLIYEDKKELNFDTGETLYRLNRYGTTTGIEKKLSESLKTELYYEFSLIDTFDVKPDVVLSKEDTGTLAISALRPGIIYDTRDNAFNPRKGILSGASVKLASPLLLSESNFVKFQAYGSTYRQISKPFVLAASLRGGAAWGYSGTTELPIVERFFLGGRTTVRGYAQDTLGPKGKDGNPIGGDAFICGNLELRTYLGKDLGFVLFLDGGNVWRKSNNIDPVNLKYSTGIGFRYYTPVGPISIDYGHKLNREKGESPGEIHFSIGQAF